jgi:hypothetical protein
MGAAELTRRAAELNDRCLRIGPKPAGVAPDTRADEWTDVGL